MKRCSLIIFIFISLAASGFTLKDSVKIESPQRVTTLFKTNPLPLLWGPIPLTSEFRFLIETVVKPYQSSQFGFSVLRKSPVISLFDNNLPIGDKYIVKGWRFQAAHRFYAHSRLYAPYGFYWSPSFSYSSAIVSTEDAYKLGYYLKANYWNASVLGGAQIIISESFGLDCFMGLGYQDRLWWEHDDRISRHRLMNNKEVLGRETGHLKFSMGFNFGFSF